MPIIDGNLIRLTPIYLLIDKIYFVFEYIRIVFVRMWRKECQTKTN